MSDDEVPQLSADAMAALLAFQAEQKQKEEELRNGNCDSVKIDEDWQLSQFWYDDETSKRLVKEAIYAGLESSENSVKIACISSPTLVKFFHDTQEYKNGKIELSLFEYDTRFGLKYPKEYFEYDYNRPAVLPKALLGKVDIIVADPPFLAAECLIKTAHSIRLLGKENVKILLCTGAIMEEYASRLFGMHRTNFEPRHANNLANDFACFANYSTKTL